MRYLDTSEGSLHRLLAARGFPRPVRAAGEEYCAQGIFVSWFWQRGSHRHPHCSGGANTGMQDARSDTRIVSRESRFNVALHSLNFNGSVTARASWLVEAWISS